MQHARSDYNDRIQDTAGLIPEDEPVLLIRGQDLAAVPAGEAWLSAAEELGAEETVLRPVRAHLERVRRWQTERTAKVPDVPVGVI